MKLKELPKSLFNSAKLALAPISSFKEDTKPRIPVIVSLTSIPSRIKSLHLTIRSLLNQDVLPKKIVLWLHNDFKNSLPKQLNKLIGNTFEIRFSPYTFSHRKLIHSIETYPDAVIITCDDDLIYHRNSIEKLYQAHLKTPDIIIGNRCRYISYNQNNTVIPYLKWPFYKRPSTKNIDKKFYMPVGAFLVLYPPSTLDQRFNDIDLIYKLAPKSDDLWFKAMALLKDTLSLPSDYIDPEPIPIMGTQTVSLKKVNTKQDYNRAQWEQINTYFNLTTNH